MHLIVDGYNIIGAWPMFSSAYDLEQQRHMLINLLCDYAGYTGNKVTLVFDAYLGKRFTRTVEDIAGITVVYTKSGETADHYIERLVHKLCKDTSRQIEIMVATNDAIEQSIILSRGAARLSAGELHREVTTSIDRGKPKAAPKQALGDTLPGDVLQKLDIFLQRQISDKSEEI